MENRLKHRTSLHSERIIELLTKMRFHGMLETFKQSIRTTSA